MKYLDTTGLEYLWSKIGDNFYTQSELDTRIGAIETELTGLEELLAEV